MGEMNINQIIVVTDGKSNIGGDPVMATKEAAKNGITVSTIGIMGKGDGEEDCIDEIRRIAKNGGGEWELTYIENLSMTLQMVTQKTINRTISTVVNKQLKEIIGQEIDEMMPKERKKFVEYIENLSDEIFLRCCIILDSSGSMKPKLIKARESIIDLMNSLKARKGRSEVAIIAYPGKNGEMYDLINGFTDDTNTILERLREIKANGTTPTAPAIYGAIKLFNNRYDKKEIIEDETALLEENIV